MRRSQVPLGYSLTSLSGTDFDRTIYAFKPLLWAFWAMVLVAAVASALFLALSKRFSAVNVK